MEKEAAKVFKKYSGGNIKVLKKYRGAIKLEKPTTAIETSNLHLFSTLGKIMLEGKKSEQKLVGNAILDLKEDKGETTGIYIKY